jgi:hypothetical protein
MSSVKFIRMNPTLRRPLKARWHIDFSTFGLPDTSQDLQGLPTLDNRGKVLPLSSSRVPIRSLGSRALNAALPKPTPRNLPQGPPLLPTYRGPGLLPNPSSSPIIWGCFVTSIQHRRPSPAPRVSTRHCCTTSTPCKPECTRWRIMWRC